MALILCGLAAQLATAETPTSESLDRLLLEGLDAAAPQPTETLEVTDSAQAKDGPLARHGEHPLHRITGQMRIAAGLLSAEDRGDLHAIQRQIVADLDDLLAGLEEPERGEGRPATPGRIAAGSRAPAAAGEQGGNQAAGDAAAATAGGDATASLGSGPGDLVDEAWGHLPERLRQQLRQTTPGEFLPKYQFEIETYFRRLTEMDGPSGGPP